MTLDNSIKIKFPALEQWGKWYVRWFGSMVASFKSRYGLEIAEDAVSQAFFKVMFGSDGEGSKYADQAKTEKGWYSFVWWQAKGILSHFFTHEETEEKYGQRAAKECAWCGETVGFKEGLDDSLMAKALDCVLDDLSERGGFDRDTVTIYRRCYLDGRDPVEVAAQFGKKNVSSVYVARFRVEKALGRYGRELYQRHLGRLFLEAA